MANLKNMRLVVLLGRATALVVALAVVLAIGMAAACPWMCDGSGGMALRSQRCDTPTSLAQRGVAGAGAGVGHGGHVR